MPLSSGTYSLPAGNPVVSGTTIQASWANTTLADIAAALSLTVLRDGQAAMTGPLNMGTQNILNAGQVGTGTLVVTGSATLGNLIITSSSVPANGVYLPGANTLGFATASTQRLTIDANGHVNIAQPGTAGPALAISAFTSGASAFQLSDGTAQVTFPVGTATNQSGIGTATAHAFNLFTSNTNRINISPSGAVAILAPPASVAALTVNGASGNYAATLVADATAGNALGLRIRGGTNASDYALVVSNQPASTTYMTIRGDGITQIYDSLNSINGLKNAATYETGSFTGTLTGCTTSPTATFNWSRSGNVITLTCAGLTGTSNSLSCTVTGLPAAITPARTQEQPVRVIDNGAGQMGLMSVFGATLGLTATVSGNTFTASGTKGISSNFSYSYALT